MALVIHDLQWFSFFFWLISDTDVLAATLKGHSDAVWSLSYNTSRQHLLSASSDGTVKLWSPTSKTQPLIRSFENDTTTSALPTSVDWVRDDLTHMVAAYSNADCVIYDIETGNPVIKLETTQVNYGYLSWFFPWNQFHEFFLFEYRMVLTWAQLPK